MPKIARPPKEKTVGEIRYFTYYVTFPDGETWVDQRAFVHDLQFELKNGPFGQLVNRDPAKARDMLQKGETTWKLKHGSLGTVTHRLVIEKEPRPKIWGKGRLVLS